MRLFVENLGGFQQQVKRAALEQRAEMRSMTLRTAEEVIAKLNARLPAVQQSTANFSMRVVVDNPGKYEVDILTARAVGQQAAASSRGGAFVVTRPHRIEGHPLRWFDKQGVPQFAMFVQHPGNRGQARVSAQTPSAGDEDLVRISEMLVNRSR